MHRELHSTLAAVQLLKYEDYVNILTALLTELLGKERLFSSVNSICFGAAQYLSHIALFPASS